MAVQKSMRWQQSIVHIAQSFSSVDTKLQCSSPPETGWLAMYCFLIETKSAVQMQAMSQLQISSSRPFFRD